MQVRLRVTSIDRRERKRVGEAQTLSSGLSEKDSGAWVLSAYCLHARHCARCWGYTVKGGVMGEELWQFGMRQPEGRTRRKLFPP